MPKLWEKTIEAHRREVRDAILDTTAALALQRGLLTLTMSEIAEATGIGRATLYKYFPDVETILVAWHERQVAGHLQYLAALGNDADDGWQRLAAVLEAYAFIVYESSARHDGELVAFLHADRHLARSQHQLRRMISDLLKDAADRGELRTDTAPEELAGYCLHALTAARGMPSKAAVGRLLRITLAGLRAER
jgi:AcrR family transcriptional regulator